MPLPRRLHLLAFAAGLALLAPTARADAPTPCDIAAANPMDPGRLAPGHAFGDLDGAAAEEACRASLADHPDDPRLTYQLGRALDRLARFDEAKAAYLKALAGGYAPAAHAYGKLAELGLGGGIDLKTAADYYQRALDGGFKPAAGDLAYLHERGLGVKRDATEAARLYAIAVEAGDGWSALNLGILYENGKGVSEDLAKAAELYEFAADHGEAIANLDLGLLLMDGRGVTRDPAAAVNRYRMAHESGVVQATIELARAYRYGIGIDKDVAEAAKLFEEAAQSDDEAPAASAMNEQAWLLAQTGGDLVKASTLIAKAIDWMRKYQHPDLPNALDTSAWIKHLRGDDKAALIDEQAAVEVIPDYAASHDRLGDILAALGRKEDARAEWQKALGLDLPDSEPDWDRAAVEKKLAAD